MSLKDSAPSDFRICIYDNGEWAEICRDIIQVEYEDSETEVDRGTETARMSLDYKRRYEDAVKYVHLKAFLPYSLEKLNFEISYGFKPATAKVSDYGVIPTISDNKHQ